MSGNDESVLTDFQFAASRALAFQSYVFRRAWGIYFGIWGTTIIAFFLASLLIWNPSSPIFSQSGQFEFAILSAAILFVAVFSARNLLKKAKKTVALRQLIGTNASIEKDLKRDTNYRHNLLVSGGWVVLFYSIVAVAFAFFGPRGLAAFFAFLMVIDIRIYYQLNLSFQNPPLEGKIAVVTYALVCSVSLIFSFLSPQTWIYIPIWIVNGLVWILCSFYAINQAHDELTVYPP